VITSAAVSQELSTEVYPSEDELYLALAAGEIDYHQFLILREVIRTGIDATNRHLLDEVPNLSYFHGDTISLSTNLQREQADGFDPRVRADVGTHGECRYRYYRYLEEASESQYRGSIRFARTSSGELHAKTWVGHGLWLSGQVARFLRTARG
jgi:hypothetical protein